jgi:hypothetical protein
MSFESKMSDDDTVIEKKGAAAEMGVRRQAKLDKIIYEDDNSNLYRAVVTRLGCSCF